MHSPATDHSGAGGAHENSQSHFDGGGSSASAYTYSYISVNSSAANSPIMDAPPGIGMHEVYNQLLAPDEVQMITEINDLNDVCSKLLYDSNTLDPHSTVMIALDLEGRDLGRNGRLCIITLATVECIYLIDMVLLQPEVLLHCRSLLREVLQSPLIVKLMFDCRGDCESLFFSYNIHVRNVCDLQVAYCLCHDRSAPHLPSMKTVFSRLALLQDNEKEVKRQGKDFFNPDSGGSYDYWEKRPLHPLLVQYCAVDVRHFFSAYQLLCSNSTILTEAKSISYARVERVCRGEFSNEMSMRDFNT